MHFTLCKLQLSLKEKKKNSWQRPLVFSVVQIQQVADEFFSAKGQKVNLLELLSYGGGYNPSVIVSKYPDNMQTNEHGYVPLKLFTKTGGKLDLVHRLYVVC